MSIARGKFVLDDNGWKHGHSDILPGQKTHHRHVIHLGGDHGLDIQTHAERIEAGANETVRCRKNNRMSAQMSCKVPAIPDTLWGGNQADPLLRQPMGDEGRHRVGRRRPVGQHHVQI